jgi:FHA domain-containing protein
MSEVNKRIGDWLGSVEDGLGRLFGQAKPSADVPPRHEREPVEWRVAALREIADEVQSTGRGGYYFPHERVTVTLHDAALKPAFANPHFEADVRAELKERGCERADIPVAVESSEEEGPAYRIEYADAPRASIAEVAANRPAATLTVLQGNAVAREVVIAKDRVFIGRLAEVRFKDGRISRRNDLAFDDSETTVARKHAFIQYDSAAGRFRVFNDPECDLGTLVFRDGATIPSDAARGVQLRDGDEIHVGNARVRFELTKKSPES